MVDADDTAPSPKTPKRKRAKDTGDDYELGTPKKGRKATPKSTSKMPQVRDGDEGKNGDDNEDVKAE